VESDGHILGHSDPTCVDYGSYGCGPSSYVEYMSKHLAGQIIRSNCEANTIPARFDLAMHLLVWVRSDRDTTR
jgi:hypothetical protein